MLRASWSALWFRPPPPSLLTPPSSGTAATSRVGFPERAKPAAALLGRSPGLAPSDLLNGVPRFQVDFRSVYAAVLEQWLRVRSESILGRKFEGVKLV